jgi:hypothetical protein
MPISARGRTTQELGERRVESTAPFRRYVLRDRPTTTGTLQPSTRSLSRRECVSPDWSACARCGAEDVGKRRVVGVP